MPRVGVTNLVYPLLISDFMKLKEDINKIIQSTFSEYNIATKQCPNPLIFALIRQNKNDQSN